ncbi:hypothetical protein C1I97_38545 [Streptomyces sp. NTH33]|uniref:hypothetical protein n=1 Tax=Streptomyces sp. NTH33 TaxID=1735453 RepID=UPI000DA87DA1|nr:hypothetical protein [Streptomyces sp. NTH33]PZG69876.1 hypothetical protein C1I97_38545 [Streptomyces sp. NTH33]
MNDEEQDHAAWRTEQHRRAQAHAFTWAEEAQTHYEKAIHDEDEARRRSSSGMAYRTAELRQSAQFHGVRSTEALKLAHMWATVTTALAAPNPQPGAVELHTGSSLISSECRGGHTP